MIPYTPIPSPIYSMGTTPYGDSNKTYNPDNGLGLFVFGGQNLPLDAKEQLATAIEKCFWTDLSGDVDVGQHDIQGGTFKIELIHDGSALTGIRVGAHVHSLVEAASLAHVIRVDTGTAPYAGPPIV